MKNYFLICFSLFTVCLSAQDTPSFFAVNAGTSIPVGKFHAKDLPDGCFAQAGFNTSIEGAWFFKPWMGIGANAGLYLHPVDAERLTDEKLSENIFYSDLVIRSEPYTTISGYAGLYFNFPAISKLSVTAKALGGLIYARTPYQLYKAEYVMIGKNWFDITAAGDYEFSFMAGAGLRYDFNDNVGLALNSEFTYNKCEFDFYTVGGALRTENKVISFVDISIGLVIGL